MLPNISLPPDKISFCKINFHLIFNVSFLSVLLTEKQAKYIGCQCYCKTKPHVKSICHIYKYIYIRCMNKILNP